MRHVLAAAAIIALAACNCGGRPLQHVSTCKDDPALCPPAPDAGQPPPPDAGQPPDAGATCDTGAVTGRVCAPDQQTWVNGAAVTVDATDCNGQAVHAATTSAADGSFTLTGVPPGHWTVHAELGSFTQDTPVDVSANQTSVIPDNQLCVAQKTVQIAVVTGSGDKIESLLTSLNLTFTTYLGDSTNWPSSAGPFLADLAAMQKFDIIFIDCGAAKASSSSTIDFGTSASQIEQNLAAYVQAGGSVYASDWALLFPHYAQQGKLDFLLNGGGAVSDPLATKYLMGYAPQTVSATVTDSGLATFLGKAQVSITFPKQSGASSLHWGLMQNVDPSVTVLVQAPTVQTCETKDTYCSSAGATATSIPLAVDVKVTPASQKGGHVVYTSFHNIAQTGTDVAQILKYIILHL